MGFVLALRCDVLLQERWEDPEEEYYMARHSSAAPAHGRKQSDSEELEIDAAPSSTSASKAKRMHPFGAGIRQGPLNHHYWQDVMLLVRGGDIHTMVSCILFGRLLAVQNPSTFKHNTSSVSF